MICSYSFGNIGNINITFLGGYKMLSTSNSIYEIEQAHETDSLKQIAKELGVSEAKLKQVLKLVGYRYNSATKKWGYVKSDASQDFRNCSIQSIMDNDLPSNTDITDEQQETVDNQDITESNTGNNEVAEFTQEEIQVLKQLAQQQMKAGTSGNLADGSHSIIQAIQSVPTGSTNKKTFAISESVIEQLDAFCDSHRIKKSDFLAVAILETLSKYS